jgi:hypothetical protein
VVASVRCAGAVPTRIERDGSTPCARANASGSPGSGGRHQQLGGPAACRHNALSTGPETLAERRAATAASATDLPPRPYTYVVSLLAALALLVVPAVASAAKGFTEQVASARWSTPFQCPDGSTAADGRLIVETDNFIEAGTTPDPNPPLRVAFVGQCPDGTFSWGFVRAAPTQFDPDLKNVSVSGTFADVRDNRAGCTRFRSTLAGPGPDRS